MPPESPSGGWDYSRTADFLLFLAILVTTIGGVVLFLLSVIWSLCLIWVIVAFRDHSRWRELVELIGQGMLGVVLSAILWIVLSRVQGLSRRP